MEPMKFTVVGAGAWGTAFSLYLSRLGHTVTLAPRRIEHAEAIKSFSENRDYLPGFSIPTALLINAHLQSSLAGVECVILACPAQALRQTCEHIKEAGFAKGIVVSLAKGLEVGSHLRPSEVIASVLPEAKIGTLTGPTNAAEVAKQLPCAMVLAGVGDWLGPIQTALSSAKMRIYTSDDLIGVELGGALKNVYAIAAGCADGLKLGDNSRAALLTRALAEMVRVGVALGARTETFYGLSGFGDLVATCHGGWSRNRDFGEHIGAGADVAKVLSHRKTVVEGYSTTESFAGLCDKEKIDAPILNEMRAILFEERKPSDALAALMLRGLKVETHAKI
jgi:glycerol-3-phosphate dehydrogenase (NAD(P)+)